MCVCEDLLYNYGSVCVHNVCGAVWVMCERKAVWLVTWCNPPDVSVVSSTGYKEHRLTDPSVEYLIHAHQSW